MKILILGGHGFVGKNVVEILRDSNHQLFPLSRHDGLDLTDYASTKKHFLEVQPDVIINCAAVVGSLNYVTQQAAEIVDLNMRMILNIYKAAQKSVPEAVLINPVANCAFPGELETYAEDSLWKGKVHQSVLSYGSTRRMMTVMSECYKMQYGFRSINFLVPNMYGQYDSTDPNKAHALNALIGKMVKAKEENKKEIEVWGSGIAIREWLYSKDCAAIFFHTLENIDSVGFGNF